MLGEAGLAFQYEIFKKWILAVLVVSADAFHVYLGVLCLLFIFWASRKPYMTPVMVLPGFVLSMAMECVDLWNIYHVHHEIWWLASLHDLVTTNLLPVLLVFIFGKLSSKEKSQPAIR